MKTILLVLLVLNTVLLSFAQENEQIKKINGIKISKNDLTLNLQQIVDTARIMGLSVVFINNGNIVYNNTFGFKNKETNAFLNDTTKMYAASFTKPVSAYLFLKLVDQGVFNLDTPLCKYLKNPIGSYEKWKDLETSKDFEKITPRMILSHSSGLPIMRYLYNDKLTLLTKPGTKFYYSNEGMNLIGFILEEYTGKKLQSLAVELIFAPLSMNNTSMVWQPFFDTNYALGYDKTGQLIGMSKRTVAKAAGSMTTIASDYARFIIAIMKQKGLNSMLFNEMLRPQIKIISNRGFGPERDSLTNKYDKIALSWGLGVGLFTSIYGTAFFHTGHDDGWQNYFVAYPDKKAAVILMSNSSNFEPAADKIVNLFIDDTASPFEWLGYYDNNQ